MKGVVNFDYLVKVANQLTKFAFAQSANEKRIKYYLQSFEFFGKRHKRAHNKIMDDNSTDHIGQYTVLVSNILTAIRNLLHRLYLRHVLPYLTSPARESLAEESEEVTSDCPEKHHSSNFVQFLGHGDVPVSDNGEVEIIANDSNGRQGNKAFDARLTRVQEADIGLQQAITTPDDTQSEEKPVATTREQSQAVKTFLRKGTGLIRRNQGSKKSLFSSSRPRPADLFKQREATPNIHTTRCCESNSALVDNLTIELEEMSENYTRSTAELANVHGELSNVKTWLETALKDRAQLQAVLDNIQSPPNPSSESIKPHLADDVEANALVTEGLLDKEDNQAAKKKEEIPTTPAVDNNSDKCDTDLDNLPTMEVGKATAPLQPSVDTGSDQNEIRKWSNNHMFHQHFKL